MTNTKRLHGFTSEYVCPHGHTDMMPELHPDDCNRCPYLGVMASMNGMLCRVDEPDHPARRKTRNRRRY